jgi:hypothetical protein
VLDLVTYLIQTPIFEWYMARCGSTNGYKKDKCLKESRLRAQDMITMLGSIVNIIGGTYTTNQ